ncbi:AAA family ATPase [Deinococcus multiflagellatus]|uniref:AAA family ATPase n=1 Tax=Deinococcus multiflagellatus TaxID=1656887 RepID=UPI001CCDFC8D|nr:AAA family ATPase [Deinococcus multiflagellatus]MBZ9714502.1 AAA family ATPase [Deinococcus multiflagellatus]
MIAVTGLLVAHAADGVLVRDAQGVTAAWIGTIPDAQPGDYLTATGAVLRDRTLAVQGARVLARADDLARAFLQHAVRGVGPRLAHLLVSQGGPGLLDRLADGEMPPDLPDRLRRPVQDACRSPTREAFATLHLLGLTAPQVLTVIRAWGTGAAARLASTPFDALALGLSFPVLDRVHGTLGGTPDDPARHAALAYHAVQRASLEHGHMRLPTPQVLFALQDTSALSAAEAQRAITTPLLTQHAGHLYLPARCREEQDLAGALRRLLRAAPRGTLPLPPRGPLSTEQYGALGLAERHPVTVLTGGPGTGKSTTLRALAEMLGRGRLALAAPTGKAAARLSDTTGREAQTLHRLLGAGARGFTFHGKNPLPLDALVIDEASMIDTALLLAVLDAVTAGTRVILVGDVHQLPPIAPGLPLQALLGTVPTTHLTRIYRQAQDSPIVALAYDIGDGERLRPETLPLPFTELQDAQTAARLALDAGAQLLAPTRKGPLGTQALNAAARRLSGRSGGLPVTDGQAGVGDPVVCTRNLHGAGVMNGMMGVVTGESEQDGGTLTVQFDDTELAFQGTARAALMPAYALTVHRAQGSEWPAVAVVLHGSHSVMLSRTLAYTAVTRAKETLLLMGELEAWNQAITHPTPPRHCGLEERLHT